MDPWLGQLSSWIEEKEQGSQGSPFHDLAGPFEQNFLETEKLFESSKDLDQAFHSIMGRSDFS